jgi:hypothetical protein
MPTLKAGMSGSNDIVSGQMTLTINIRTTIAAPAGLEQMVADALEEIFDAQQKSGNDHFFVEVNGWSSATAIWSDRWRFVPNYGGDTGF